MLVLSRKLPEDPLTWIHNTYRARRGPAAHQDVTVRDEPCPCADVGLVGAILQPPQRGAAAQPGDTAGAGQWKLLMVSRTRRNNS